MLIPGEQVLLRRRGQRDTGPWLVGRSVFGDLRFSATPDNGWLVHAGDKDTVLLEALALPKSTKARFLSGFLGSGVPSAILANRKGKATPSLRWKVHPTGANTFLLECQSRRAGPKWLAINPRAAWAVLTDRPQGRSLLHEFIALPVAHTADYLAAEEAGDYSYLAQYDMASDGWPMEMPRPKRPHRTLTGQTPRHRAGDDPVARELIAALQPSFEDGRGGEEDSDYDPDDSRRIGWPHNIISLDTVATPTGIVRLNASSLKHDPPAGELAHCRRLAGELVKALGRLEPHGGDHPTPFLPFYLVRGKRDPLPDHLTSEVVRAAFRGTIYPETPIQVHPINPDFPVQYGDEWTAFARWAARQAELAEVSYVDVGYGSAQEPNYAAVFPRLVLGLTKAGSLVGACGSIVQA